MSNKPETFDDDRLDELLRNVQVPQDLKSSLNQIPREHPRLDSRQINETTRLEPGSLPADRSIPWMLVLAACLAAVAAFATWQWLPVRNAINNDNHVVDTDPARAANDEGITEAPTQPLTELADLNTQIEDLKSLLNRLELQAAENQLALVQPQNEIQISTVESQSIIMALATEISMPLGGDEELIKSGMAQVIEKFPGSHGARIANEYLRQNEN